MKQAVLLLLVSISLVMAVPFYSKALVTPATSPSDTKQFAYAFHPGGNAMYYSYLNGKTLVTLAITDFSTTTPKTTAFTSMSEYEYVYGATVDPDGDYYYVLVQQPTGWLDGDVRLLKFRTTGAYQDYTMLSYWSSSVQTAVIYDTLKELLICFGSSIYEVNPKSMLKSYVDSANLVYPYVAYNPGSTVAYAITYGSPTSSPSLQKFRLSPTITVLASNTNPTYVHLSRGFAVSKSGEFVYSYNVTHLVRFNTANLAHNATLALTGFNAATHEILTISSDDKYLYTGVASKFIGTANEPVLEYKRILAKANWNLPLESVVETVQLYQSTITGSVMAHPTLADSLVYLTAEKKASFASRGCGPGLIVSTTEKECTYCKPGTFSTAVDSASCTKCAPSTFQALYGKTQCDFCRTVTGDGTGCNDAAIVVGVIVAVGAVVCCAVIILVIVVAVVSNIIKKKRAQQNSSMNASLIANQETSSAAYHPAPQGNPTQPAPYYAPGMQYPNQPYPPQQFQAYPPQQLPPAAQQPIYAPQTTKQ